MTVSATLPLVTKGSCDQTAERRVLNGVNKELINFGLIN